MRKPRFSRHILETLHDIDGSIMTSLSRIGIAGVLAAVAAAVIYLVAISGDLGAPAGDGADASGQARAEKLFAGLKNSQRFKESGGSVVWESARALGDEGVSIRKLRIAGADWDGRPTEIAADELRVRRIDWNNVSMSPYGDIEIRGLTATNERIAAIAAASGMSTTVADLTARWDYAADSRIMDLQTLEFAIREWGTLSLTMRLHGLEPAAWENIQDRREMDPAYVVGLMAGAKIGRFSLSFKDNGAIDRLATKRAEVTGTERQQIIDQALKGLEIHKAAQNHAIVRQAFDALIQFVKTRGTIAVEAMPKRPIALLRLALADRSSPDGIDRLARELGLSVEAR